MNAFPSLLAALTAAPEKIPDLKPPRGAIPPTFWEEYGLALCIFGAVGLVVLAAIIHRLRQPKPVVVPTPADIARRELDALRGHKDATVVNTEAARILRGFLIKKFGLAGPGLTADEIAAHLPTDEVLAAELHLFLQHCDVANFAPAAPLPSAGAVIEDALESIDAVERQTPQPPPAAQSGILKSA